jgi:hypothetical protein
MSSKIRIKNFGPIKEGVENNGWIEIKKVTAFIGNQGSGKSTVAKLISTFTWLEKVLTRGDYKIEHYSRRNGFVKKLLPYHRLENYIIKDQEGNIVTEIQYEGCSYNISFKKGELKVVHKGRVDYSLPQIMYVPAERNFIAYVKKPNELKLSSDSLKEFLSEFNDAKENIKGTLDLPINQVNLDYDKLNDVLNVKGSDYKVRLSEASSGFQSLVPLYIVSEYLAKKIKNQDRTQKMSADEEKRFEKGLQDIYKNDMLTDEQRRIAISTLASRFNKTSFVNIVEEPEQNLFPSSQETMLESLITFNNYNQDNKLIITTHSPYLINHISVLIKAGLLYRNDNILKKEILEETILEDATIKDTDYVIYQMNEENGTIQKLNDYKGIPSDEDYLNGKLAESNDKFAKLLEIEQKFKNGSVL